jgi:hypothetical protein
MRLEGFLTVTDENMLITKLTEAQYSNIQIDATAIESLGQARVLRNTDDPIGSEVFLEIKCEPTPKPFVISQIIGAGAPGPFIIDVKGRALSERVDP